MNPDDHVCLCYRVSLRKLVNFMKREQPVVPSQLADCLGAGTGCHWCVPFLERLYEQWQHGHDPHLPVSPDSYAKRRASYHCTGRRDESAERGE